MKMLWVGDPHATVRELEDVKNLVGLIEEVALQEKVDRILFAGDLYDNFSLVNTQVMQFWRESFARLNPIVDELICLKGNHDMSNDSTSESHALMAHPEITVYDKPTLDAESKVVYMPFIRDPTEFVKAALEWKDSASLMFCHQDFSGARYENGFYSKEGVDPSLLPYREIVSGHIHSTYQFGNVWYPGAPRWRTLSDASQLDRFIYVLNIEDGQIKGADCFSTKNACRRIIEINLAEGEPDMLSQPIENNADYRISITGSEAYVRDTETRVKVKIPGAKIATVIFDESVKLRESEGISTSFRKWFDTFNPPYGTDKDVLRAMVKDRVRYV